MEPGPAPLAPAPDRPFVEPVVLRPLAVAPLVATAAFGLLGWRGGNPWLLLLACAAAGPFLVSWLARPRLDAVEVVSALPARAVAGEGVAWTVLLRNTGRRPTPALLVTGSVAGYDDASVLVEPVPQGGSAHATLRRTARRRGWSAGHRVTLATSAPFGLVERRLVLADDRPAIVHPPTGRPAGAAVRGGAGEDPAGAPARTGPDLHAVREWRPGDDTRHVHWRSTARHGRLVVVEPERTVTRRLAVVVAGPAGDPGWEPLLSRVAGTVVDAARAGRRTLVLARDPAAAGRLPAGEPGLAGAETDDGVLALDLLAALTAVDPPRGDDLRRAAQWAGPDADLLVAVARPPDAAWWGDLVGRTADLGVRLHLLTADDG